MAMGNDHNPAAAVAIDDGIVQALATGAAPGAVIEQAATAVRFLCPDRGLAVWYRHEDGTAVVQAAGIGAHLVMITGDPESPFWTRARSEPGPNYRITFHAHPEDVSPTSVWCVPVTSGPVAGDLTLVAVGPEGPPPEADVQAGLEHITRLLAVSLDRKRLVERLDNAHDRPDGRSPAVARGIVPTRGDADEPADTALFYLRLAEITDIDHVHGHNAAEELAVEVGHRLSATVRPGDTVARIGSTDFALRCYRVTAIQAESIAARVLNDLWTPVVTRWEETRLRPRIGLSRSSDPTPLSEMLKGAEAAMRRADTIGRDWLWDGDEAEPETAPAPAPVGRGFGAGLQEAAGADDQSEPGRLADSASGSPE
jgi:GGDEF domain-containing protein